MSVSRKIENVSVSRKIVIMYVSHKIEIHRRLIVVFEVVFVLFAIKETNKLNSNNHKSISAVTHGPCVLNSSV